MSGSEVPEVIRPIKPRANLFRMLSILWIFPSFGAIWIILLERSASRKGLTLFQRLQEVTLEQWITIVILLAHVAFVWFARHYERTEVPRLPVPAPSDSFKPPS